MRGARPHRLQIFGERCSGTNYVAQLLRRNVAFLRPTDEFGWKHGFTHRVPAGSPECLFVVVHRDPYDWVRSLHRTPWHAAPPLRNLDLPHFLRAPWWCEWGQDMEMPPDDPRRGTEMLHERDPVTHERFPNVLAMRTAKLRAWLRLAGHVRHVAFVRYEDAAGNPRAFLRDLAHRFELRRWPWFRAVKTWKGGRERFAATSYAPFSPTDLEWVTRHLDADVEARFGCDVAARAAELRSAPAESSTSPGCTGA